jgi:hypothetical protein
VPAWGYRHSPQKKSSSFGDDARDDDDYRNSMADLIATAEGKLSGREVRELLTTLIHQGWEKAGSMPKGELSNAAAELCLGE